jgi:hypothetical protein
MTRTKSQKPPTSGGRKTVSSTDLLSTATGILASRTRGKLLTCWSHSTSKVLPGKEDVFFDWQTMLRLDTLRVCVMHKSSPSREHVDR